MKIIASLILSLILSSPSFAAAPHDYHSSRPHIYSVGKKKLPYQDRVWDTVKSGTYYKMASLMAIYPKAHFFFFARDAEYNYDIISLLLKDRPKDLERMHLVNVSTQQSRETDVAEYMSQNGLNAETLKGNYAIMIDSGFAGSVPRAISKEVPIEVARLMRTHLVSSANDEIPETSIFLCEDQSQVACISNFALSPRSQTIHDQLYSLVEHMEDLPHYTTTGSHFAQDENGKWLSVVNSQKSEDYEDALALMKDARHTFDNAHMRRNFKELTKNFRKLYDYVSGNAKLTEAQLERLVKTLDRNTSMLFAMDLKQTATTYNDFKLKQDLYKRVITRIRNIEINGTNFGVLFDRNTEAKMLNALPPTKEKELVEFVNAMINDIELTSSTDAFDQLSVHFILFHENLDRLLATKAWSESRSALKAYLQLFDKMLEYNIYSDKDIELEDLIQSFPLLSKDPELYSFLEDLEAFRDSRHIYSTISNFKPDQVPLLKNTLVDYMSASLSNFADNIERFHDDWFKTDEMGEAILQYLDFETIFGTDSLLLLLDRLSKANNKALAEVAEHIIYKTNRRNTSIFSGHKSYESFIQEVSEAYLPNTTKAPDACSGTSTKRDCAKKIKQENASVAAETTENTLEMTPNRMANGTSFRTPKGQGLVVQKLLHESSRSFVYLVKSPKGKLFALKVMRKNLAYGHHNLLQERKILTRLRSLGLNSITAAEVGKFYILKDYVEGQTGSQVIKSWSKMKSPKNSKSFQSLITLVRTIALSGVYIGKLTPTNLIWDGTEWHIVDADKVMMDMKPEQVMQKYDESFRVRWGTKLPKTNICEYLLVEAA